MDVNVLSCDDVKNVMEVIGVTSHAIIVSADGSPAAVLAAAAFRALYRRDGVHRSRDNGGPPLPQAFTSPFCSSFTKP